MYDILTAIYHDDPLQYGTCCNLSEPLTPVERQVACALSALEPETAQRLKSCVQALMLEQGEKAFRNGARFGSQIMAQFLEEI